jgi:hypothetical protein
VKKQTQTKVMVSVAGGLGNQLFQIAAGLAISEGKGIELETGVAHPRRNNRGEAEIESFKLPESIKVRKLKYPNWLMRKNINLFLRLGASSKNFHKVPGYRVILWLSSAINTIFFKEWRQTVAAVALGDSPIHVPRGKIYLVGLFQSQRWPASKDVYSVMTNFKVLNPSEELASLEEAASTEEPLVVHVRLGDYLAEDSFGIPSKTYYENAVKLALEKQCYKSVWLFSNDLESAREFLPKNLRIPVREIGDVGDSSAQVLQAMRLGRGYVIGNSTFSWWGAFLSHTQDPQVFFPTPWFKKTYSPENLTPEDWVPVEAWPGD